MLNTVGVVIGYVGLAATAIAALITGLRALIRGPKEDKKIEVEIQDRIATLAERWLRAADERLTATEQEAKAAKERADAAERAAADLSERVDQLEANLQSAMSTIEVLWTWGLAGGGEPYPKIADWIYERLHKP